MRTIRWPGPEGGAGRSKRPYRDAALVYAGLALAIVVLAVLTGGSLSRALITAAFFYVVATAWTWIHLRRRRPKEEVE